ncbi:probable protein phosphatase 2C 74 [Setaria viridis]|uniref:probable protein phosphatase 2C 74 n=1 Tax=Setaria viridis TaxID=4556 RepID=UPI003B3B7142
MMLYTVRFLCSVVAAFARLVRELRKAIAAMAASSAMMSPIPSAPKTAAVSPVGLIATTPLPLRKKALATVTIPEMKLLAALAPPPQVVAPDVEVEQQMDSKRRRKADWLAGRRPSRLVLPVADDAGEVAAGWGAAAAAVKEADVEVEGEGFWVASRAGPRHAMEDAYSVITGKNGGDSQLAFYGVFDGHGGRAAVDFVSQRLGNNVVSAVLAAEGAATTRDDGASSAEAEHDAVSAAIRAAYLATDSELLAKHQGASGGVCAATALVKNGDLYVAHLGDCRAVLSHDGGAAAALTADHTCAAEGERERIERGGGYVSRSGSGVWRVQGSLAVSRSFGDCGLKQWVVAEPAVTRVPLVAGCEFLVIASDGLWDKVSNQEAVDVVSRSGNAAAAAASAGRSCAELVELARRRGSRDDVTVMVIDLERFVR